MVKRLKNKEMKAKIRFVYLLLSVFITGSLVSCDKDSEGISSIVSYPVFEMVGADFINVKAQTGGTFIDPGITATVDGEALTVTTTGSVNLGTPGLYTLEYSTEVGGDFPVTAKVSRQVLVTDELMTVDLYSGSYKIQGGKTITMKVTKLHDGHYKASDIWFQTKAVPVEFIDYGGTTGLVALPGTSNYGSFTGTLSYTDDIFNFQFMITEGVNAGLKWNTNWARVN